MSGDAPRPPRGNGHPRGDHRGARPRQGRRPPGDRPKKRDVSGWVVLDKGVGMTSTHAVALVKRALNAKKAGHAGTLDPLASGILPIALGEATKTVPFVMDGRKAYVFTVAWGVETDTDDAEGRPVETSERRPAREEVEAALPRFIGAIEQVPPRFSAIKIAGERAYDLARDGEAVELAARPVRIDHLAVVAHEGDRTVLAAECGKGTYVRALARDLGRTLGCLGHVAALRRTRVGPFTEESACTLDDLAPPAPPPASPPASASGEGAADDRRAGDASGEAPRPEPVREPLRGEALRAVLRPVEMALEDVPSITVSRDMAARLMRGQSVLLRGRDAPTEGKLYATCGGVLVAVGDVAAGELVPHRVFHIGPPGGHAGGAGPRETP